MEQVVRVSRGAGAPGVRDDAFAVRRAVFMDEQGYENEFDEVDESPACVHLVLYVGGEPAGCARVFPEELERTMSPDAPTSPSCALDEGVDTGACYLLGRVAVTSGMRRRGLARAIVDAAEEAARAAGAQLIKLHAQEYIRSLYAGADYEQIAPVDYEDEGQPHLWMAKRL